MTFSVRMACLVNTCMLTFTATFLVCGLLLSHAEITPSEFLCLKTLSFSRRYMVCQDQQVSAIFCLYPYYHTGNQIFNVDLP